MRTHIKLFLSILLVTTITLIVILELENIQTPKTEYIVSSPVVESKESKVIKVNDEINKVRFVLGNFNVHFYYDPQNKLSVRDVSERFNYDYLINGGYFTPERTFAGGLIINNKVINSIAVYDKQLTHMVVIENSGSLSFVKILDYSLNNSYLYAFQTGPLFIDNSVIQENLIQSSLNGSGEYIRSFLGYTSDGEILIGITTERITLQNLAKVLLENPNLKDKKLTIVNLDGGSSTAFYSIRNSNLNYGISKTLPILLGFKII